jgi:hypothetical protein
MRRAFARAVLAAALALFLAGTASATVVLRAGVEDLASICHAAVLGTVETRSVALDRAAGQVWTSYRVRVDENWLGAPGSTVVVSVPGGEAEGITQDFEGGARLETGGRTALFLWRRDDGKLIVLGEGQGAFRVTRDAATGADVCANALDGLALVDRAGKRVDATPLRTTLDDLRTRVAAARTAREERERAAREAYERRMAELRKRAEESAELARGKPGGPPTR